ncbi:MAG: ATP-dependent zinc metalloprotease FtsH [Chroococcidiopsidaceae cyanobacterium CP_BM_ER_R8_30]|nr:ATP-dependent zinc metalloprotease FtsH [Chroococcidiopsidaceae cyanobacterium CP_BM_ER_R8_30]
MPVEKNDDRSPNLPKFSRISSIVLSLIVYVFLFNFLVLPLLRTHPRKVLYSTFIKQVNEGKVARAYINQEEIQYSLKGSGQGQGQTQPQKKSPSPQPSQPNVDQPLDTGKSSQAYVTNRIDANTSALVTLLEQKNVEFGAAPPEQQNFLTTIIGWVVPPLIFVGIWVWALGRMQGAGGGTALTVGKSKARIYGEGNTGVTFKDVAGIDEAKAELVEVVDFLKNPQKYSQIGAVIPKGVLLVGPPGTGKTLLAKAVAGEAGVPFFSISGSEFIELFVGVGAARVRDLFQQAKEKAPCIVFIDELDALGKARSSGQFAGSNSEQEQTLNQLLTEMDGFEGNTGVVILAATNRPEVLDPALRRPGRFDRQVIVDRPDKQGREQILRVHAKKVQLAEDVNFEALAARTAGFTGADLANLVNEAALLAARKAQQLVHMADFNEAFERVVAGLERKSRILNPEEKKIVAYHEVGHAIVGFLMPGSDKVEKISIVPRGIGALGYTLQLPEEDRFLMAEDELRGRIATLLGGRSAEEVVFGKISTGASDDIQKVTSIAERMVTLYGMDTALGPVAIEQTQQQQFLDGQNTRRTVGPVVLTQIDEEVKTIIDNAHKVAQAILVTNRELLEALAQQLIHHEVLEGEKLHQILQQAQAPSGVAEWLRTGKLAQLELRSTGSVTNQTDL